MVTMYLNLDRFSPPAFSPNTIYFLVPTKDPFQIIKPFFHLVFQISKLLINIGKLLVYVIKPPLRYPRQII